MTRHDPCCTLGPMRTDGGFSERGRTAILQWMEREGVTYSELAKRVGVKRHETVSHWINETGGGRPSIAKLQRLCKAVNMRPNDLLLDEDELDASLQQEIREGVQRVYARVLREESFGPDDPSGPSSDGGLPLPDGDHNQGAHVEPLPLHPTTSHVPRGSDTLPR